MLGVKSIERTSKCSGLSCWFLCAGRLDTRMSNPAVEPDLVTTIIPVFNRPYQLRDAVASVLQQDHRPVEVIIVDDGSTDGETRRVALELAQQNPREVFVEQQANAGPGLAREKGLQRAKGEFIQYLDSDDLLLPGKFSSQVAALRADRAADVAYGITLVREADGRLSDSPNKETGVRHTSMFPRFLIERWWNTSTPLYRMTVCRKAGPWTSLRLEEDWEYDCRIAALGGRVAYVPRPVSEHRIHEGPRLSVGEELNPVRLRMRAEAQTLIWQHALKAGLHESAPTEVAIFSRSLFLLARKCGAAGLRDDSRRLLDLAGESAKAAGGRSRDLDWYRRLTRIFGHRAVGQLSEWIDGLRAKVK